MAGAPTPFPTGVDTRPEVDLLLRKSKVVRAGENALSIRAQEERGRRWADQNGYVVRKVWKENLSAYTDIQRPVYDAAMAELLSGLVPALWCYALDRFSRKGAEAVVPILGGKARVIFDYEDLDSSRERDRRWIIQRAEDAREFSQRISYNIKVTKGRQRNEGRWLSKAPFGLFADPDTRRLRPNTEPYACIIATHKEWTPWDVVRRIFNEIAEGISARALARKLNLEGIPSPSGKMWRADGVRAIIINPTYEGWLTERGPKGPVHYLKNGKRVSCAEKGAKLIDAALAKKARRSLSGHQRHTVIGGNSAFHLLSEKRGCCHSCKSALVASGDSYRCFNVISGKLCEAPTSVQRKCIDQYVGERWAARLNATDPDDPILALVAERYAALTKPDETGAIQEATAELKAAQSALEKFHADDRAGFYEGRSARYRAPAKNQAEARVDAAEEELSKLTDPSVDISFLVNGEAATIWEKADPVLRQDLFSLVVDRVYVTQSPGRGKRFKGSERVRFEWVELAA